MDTSNTPPATPVIDLPSHAGPTCAALSEAWVDGAETRTDIFGDVDTSHCPYGDPGLADAWLAGTQTLRDWDGRADLSANPYND